MLHVDKRFATISIALLVLLSGALRAQPTDAASPGGPPSARQIAGRALAEQVVAAVGGSTAWNDPSWDISFDFVTMKDGKELSRYSHVWHRALDDYTVNGKTRDGKQWRVHFSNLTRHEGTSVLDGKEPPDSLKPRLMNAGYGRFINDTYWFMMPFKLLDSGVYHRREDDTTIGGRTYEVLSLSFAQVGLTPGDHYRLLINPSTKLVERWSYVLQGGGTGDFLWQNYTPFGPLKLALVRHSTDESFEIRFENVKVEKARPASK